MVEIFFVEEGNVGVAVMEKDGWLPPSSFLTISPPDDSLLATISTAAALSAGFASMAFDDDAVDAATATDGGDGVGRCAATVPPPPPLRLPSDAAFPTNEPVDSVDVSLTPFIFMQLIDGEQCVAKVVKVGSQSKAKSERWIRAQKRGNPRKEKGFIFKVI